MFRPFLTVVLMSVLLFRGGAWAQGTPGEWHVGYFSPFLTNVGISLGYEHELRKWQPDSLSGRKSTHRIGFASQVGYFHQFGVAHNVLLNPGVSYRWRGRSRFFLSTAIGTGYLLSLQRQDGSVNLATGDVSYRSLPLSYFLPNVSVGCGVEPKRVLGFYFNVFYGRQISQDDGVGFLGLSTGVIVLMRSKAKGQ
jgi:hypothetical protein